jgi:hypothetical protein
MGSDTMVTSRTIEGTATENSSGLMVECTKEGGSQENNMEKEFLLTKNQKRSEGSGGMERGLDGLITNQITVLCKIKTSAYHHFELRSDLVQIFNK